MARSDNCARFGSLPPPDRRLVPPCPETTRRGTAIGSIVDDHCDDATGPAALSVGVVPCPLHRRVDRVGNGVVLAQVIPVVVGVGDERVVVPAPIAVALDVELRLGVIAQSDTQFLPALEVAPSGPALRFGWVVHTLGSVGSDLIRRASRSETPYFIVTPVPIVGSGSAGIEPATNRVLTAEFEIVGASRGDHRLSIGEHR